MAEQKVRRMRLYAYVAAEVVVFCSGKTRWGSEKAAQRAITNLRSLHPSAFDSTVRPYRCPSCHRWHVGHGQ